MDIQSKELIKELTACLIDVLDADGNLNAMDFERYRKAITKSENTCICAQAELYGH